MTTGTLDQTAREAITSACADVREPVPGDLQDDVDGVRPGLVARPKDTGQVAEVMRAAAAHGLRVVPRGRGTKMTWGSPPSGVDVLLDLSDLDQVLDHAAGDLIVAAQAGTRLSDVQAVVGQAGQQLVLDETVAGGSVGGVLAANVSGLRRVAVGTARDLLIGITLVRADGVVAKAGGRVVKNVAGYDLGKLIVGSMGTLAVVVDATFRLHPVPAAHRWVSVGARDAAHAQEIVQRVLGAQVVPSALEVDWPVEGRGAVHVLLEGREEGVAARTETTRRLLGDTATDSADSPGGGETYPWDVRAIGDTRATALKLTFALSGLGDVLVAAGEAGVHVRGSAGSGVAYAAVPPGAPVDRVAQAVARLREVCTRLGGSAVVVDAPAAVKAELDVWGPVPALDLMRRVKEQFDPDRRLAPGRFVGGI